MKRLKQKPHRWKKNLAKRKRNFGESYVTNGVLRPAKTLKPPCTTKCRMKCTEKISHQQREELLREYLNLENITLKREYIIRCMEQIIPKYIRKKEGSKRSLNYAYNFYIDGNKIQVCTTFFLSTLDISYMTIQTTVKKFYREKDGLMEGEQRGKHRRLPRNELTEG